MCDGINLSGAKNITMTGVILRDSYDSDKAGVDNCHNDNLDDVRGNLTNFVFKNSWSRGRAYFETERGNVTMTVADSWISNSPGVGLHQNVKNGYSLTGSVSNVHFFSNTGDDFRTNTGVGFGALKHFGITCDSRRSTSSAYKNNCNAFAAAPSESQNPAAVWRAANTYSDWVNFLQ
jgi:hypothetical protein